MRLPRLLAALLCAAATSAGPILPKPVTQAQIADAPATNIRGAKVEAPADFAATAERLRAQLGTGGATTVQFVKVTGPVRGFEVGDEVRQAFVDRDALSAAGFTPAGRPGKWLGDLPALARRRLAGAGVASVFGGHCTVEDPGRFYSFRRDRETGRMASLIWLA